MNIKGSILFGLLITFSAAGYSQTVNSTERSGVSPWGADDQIGRLNLINEKNNLALFSAIRTGKVYDLGVEYFIGMPSFTALGDPPYQYWLTHTPRGNRVGDITHAGDSVNSKVSYTGDAVSMYTHTGTHIDALAHFGLHGKIYNGFEADQYLSDRGWKKGGAENIPPVIGRGILIDVAKYKGLDILPENYVITLKDVQSALQTEQLQIQKGDVVLIRTGLMKYFYTDAAKFTGNGVGINLEALKWLVDEKGVMTLGGDNLALEALPSSDSNNWLPGHTYLLAQKGVMFMELVYLEGLSKANVNEFLFIGLPLKLRGASASPLRPLAIPIKN
ncbi:cyclase family protein [Mucilaginibacter gossypiicola]|nr:cyclase family protein [Mucilaginibacter gossypiicola]